jgi:flagellar protein FliS
MTKSRNSVEALSAYKSTQLTISPLQQIIFLYEGIVQSLLQAKQAIEEKDIQQRYNTLTLATTAILGLQQGLNREAAKEVAEALDQFYESAYQRIMVLHMDPNVAGCDAVITEICTVLESWKDAEKQMRTSETMAESSTEGFAGGMDFAPAT